MRTIFVVNPKAGKGKGTEKFIENIKAAAAAKGAEIEIYVTKAVGDGEVFADSIGRQTAETGEEVRLFACGGDGTFNEVLNGAIRYGNLSVGVVPIGTGNDFCKNFPDAGDFRNIGAQLDGRVIKCDAIEYSGVIDGVQQTRYCANMFNIGFDCNVVDAMMKLKKYPFMAGSFAYLAGIAVTFIKKKGADLRVEIDGQVYADGPVLLNSIANGCYCGGGVKSNPTAIVQDGLMDVNIINDVTRMQFLNLFPKYSKGTHMEVPGIEKILCAKQCRKVVVKPRQGNMRLCTDGEITDAGTVEFQLIPAAFSMIVPEA